MIRRTMAGPHREELGGTFRGGTTKGIVDVSGLRVQIGLGSVT